MNDQAKLLRDAANSLCRTSQDSVHVAVSLRDPETKTKLKQVVKPNSVSKTLKKAGLLLLLSPDPITDVPAIVLLGASCLMKKKEPANAESVFNEAQRMFGEFGTLLPL